MTRPTEYLQVSYSSLNLFSSCERKFEFHKLFVNPSAREQTYAAAAGQAMHLGYQEYLATGDSSKAIWKLLRAYPYELAFMELRDDRSIEACISSLERMIDFDVFHEFEVAKIMNPQGEAVPAIEVPFAIRLEGVVLPDGRGIEFVGAIDAIMQHKMERQFCSLDIKTHRDTLKDATAKYVYNSQQTPYGIVINHLAGEALDSFKVLYLDVYLDLVEPRVTPYDYVRTDEDVQEWLLDTTLTAQRIQKSMQLQHFPRTAGGCVTYNRPCKYLDVCQSRDHESIERYLSMGADPDAVPHRIDPWIIAEIDVLEGLK